MEKDFPKGIKERLGYNADFRLDWHDPDEATDGYQLKWIGKDYARFQFGTFPDTIVKPDAKHNSQPQNQNSQNIFITGDNLQALKHLQSAYRGQVDMIYIDPPYNTGGDGFVYNDKFEFSDEVLMEKLTLTEEQIKRLNVINGRSSHSAWLTFMYPRLRIARTLLKDTGVIFISIDDNEQANLKLLCDEIFGERNFVSGFIVIRSEGGGLAKQAVIGHDYLLAYASNIDKFTPLGKYKDIRGKIIKMNAEEYWIETDWLRKEFGKYGTCLYEEIEKHLGESKKKEIDKGIKEKKYVLVEKDNFHIVGRYRKVNEDSSKFYTILKHLNKFGVHDLEELGLSDYFKFPKPISLCKELILGATIFNKSAIIMDFFAGSATTAHAVMQLNKEDGGSRRYIMVQLDEPTWELDKNGNKKAKKGSEEAFKAGFMTIDQIGCERIKRAAKQIGDSTGFKHYYVKPPDAATLDNITEFDPENPSKEDIFHGEIMQKLGGTDVVLQTYLLADGYMLTDIPQEKVIAGYTAYYCVNSVLYLIGSGWGNAQTKELLNLIGQHELNVNTIICCAYSFTFESMSELETNIRQSLIGVSVEKRY